MSTKVPIGKEGREEEAASVIFIGPTQSGKTTSLILLHQTCIDYREDLKCTYTPLIKNAGFDLYGEAHNLMLTGTPPAPTLPSVKDAKIEFDLEFKGGLLGKTKRVKLIFADMSGEISSSLMSIFPELINSTPTQVREKLLETGIDSEDVEYLIHTLLSSKGVILVADSSKLCQPDSPDKVLATYLDNLNKYAKTHGEKPKGFALLLTKFDQFKVPGFENPKQDQLRELAKNYLSQVENFASSFTKNNGKQFKIFFSVLKEGKDKEGNVVFNVESNNARHQTRVEYSVDQYRHLIEWLRDTFGT